MHPHQPPTRTPSTPTRAAARHAFEATPGFEPVSRGGFAPRPNPRPLTPSRHATAPCPVCSCNHVLLDEVQAGGGLGLAECPRCDHRWTTRAPRAATAPSQARVAFVSASRLDRAAQA